MSSYSEIGLPDLRRGEWTRRGGTAVLGDTATESLLGALAATTRDAARAQGYAAGWAEGRRAAALEALAETDRVLTARAAEDEERRAAHEQALAALGTAAEQVRGLLGGLSMTIEQQATDLAWALVTEILGHQLRTEAGPDVIARVLSSLPDAALARVRLHPSVVSEPAAMDLVDRGITVVRDEALDPADALVESNGSVVDLRISEAMARVREVLG